LPGFLSYLEPASALAREGGEVVFWGRGMTDIYGYTADEVVGRSSDEALKTRTLEPLDHVQRRIETVGYWRGKVERISKSGDRLLVESQWVRLPANGNAPIIVEIDADVSAILAHRQFENRLIEQAEALWRSNRELEQFAFVCSHDLREPLRKISNFVELLEAKYGEKLDGEARHYLDSIGESSMRMANLISGLMSYAQLQHPDPGPRNVSLRDVIDSVVSDLKPTVSAASATVEIGALPEVKADLEQMRQLLQNLIENALKFREPSRPLRLRITGEKKDGMARFSVADNGIGIEPFYREQIFKVFQRLHPAARYPGTGIGLALCKKIVEGHGGRIWVESEPGQGSTFFFTLPLPATVA
jgi:PAS domain S-box-containing protein